MLLLLLLSDIVVGVNIMVWIRLFFLLVVWLKSCCDFALLLVGRWLCYCSTSFLLTDLCDYHLVLGCFWLVVVLGLHNDVYWLGEKFVEWGPILIILRRNFLLWLHGSDVWTLLPRINLSPILTIWIYDRGHLVKFLEFREHCWLVL
jgi:hypothetical protein